VSRAPVPVESGEHARITLAYPKTGFRSYIDPRTESQTGPTTGRLEMDDLREGGVDEQHAVPGGGTWTVVDPA
jgi:hypothetical protein